MARAFPIVTGKVGAQGGADGSARYFGHSGLRETGGAAVTVRVRDGGAVSGQILDTIVLAANGTAPAAFYGPNGIAGSIGLYIETVSGTGVIEGAIFIG